MTETLRQWIQDSRHIVFFGGAGVSTESSIPDFRSSDGLYKQEWSLPPEEILSHDFFMEHTEAFYRFYRAKMLYPEAQPNMAHIALAALEKAGKLDGVITQNIDGLHQAAGSQRVYELHGSVQRNNCMRCGKRYGTESVTGSTGIPRCTCGGTLKPEVVLYGEPLEEAVVEGAVEALRHGDLLIVGGTSLAVYPAAGLLRYYRGKHIVLINRDATPLDSRADLLFRQPIGQVLAEACRDWLEG